VTYGFRGEQIAFVVTSPGEGEKLGDSDIWIVPADGKESGRVSAYWSRLSIGEKLSATDELLQYTKIFFRKESKMRRSG